MGYTITKTRQKSPITGQLVNVYTLSAFVYCKYVEYSYYGYTKQKAIKEFEKLVKQTGKTWIEYLAK